MTPRCQCRYRIEYAQMARSLPRPPVVLVATPARGAWIGNRGCFHDTNQRIVRESASARWICCRLDYRGNRRRVMTPKRYTELFFLDKATALASGHRPCGECRRQDLKRFRDAWPHGYIPQIHPSVDSIMV